MFFGNKAKDDGNHEYCGCRAFTRKGIGKKLLRHAVETAKGYGMSKLEVGTGNSSVSQLALYQKCGFRIFSIDFDYFSKHYEEEIIENGIVCRDMIRLAMELNKTI